VAAQSEHAQLASLDRLLATPGRARAARARLIGPDETTTELPRSLYEVIVRAVHQLALGNGVSILPVATELTTQEAADLLNVSRPFLVRLLDSEGIPYRYVGTHRRVRLDDLLHYRAVRDRERRAALSRMTKRAQELGIYDASDDVEG
jgi:excisionase family DNA binding protein